MRSLGPMSESSEDGRGLHVQRLPSPAKEKELSLYKKTKRAIASKKYSVSKHEAEATTPIELISRGPDGRFVMEPGDEETPVRPRRIEGFPFVEESDLYPEFRQSDEENDDPGPMPPVMPTLRPHHQISPMSSSQESYAQPPAYSPRFQRPSEGMTIGEAGRLQAVGQSRVAQHLRLLPHHHTHFYGYRGSPEFPPPFYMPDISPRSSVMSSPPPSFGYPTIPEEGGEGEGGGYATASGSTLPLSPTSSARSPEIWRQPHFPFPGPGLEGPRLIFPPLHPHRHLPEPPPLPPPQTPPLRGLPYAPYPASLALEAPPSSLSPEKPPFRPHGPPAKRLAMQEAQSQGQLRHTSHGLGVPVLPYPDPAAHRASPGTPGGPDARWYEPQARRMDPSLHQVVLQPSRLSPLAGSPPSSSEGSPEIVVRPRPRPSASQPQETTEITLQPLATAASPTQSRRAGPPSYRSTMAFATAAASYPSQSPSPPTESSDVFGQMPSQRRTEEEMLPSEPSPHQSAAG